VITRSGSWGKSFLKFPIKNTRNGARVIFFGNAVKPFKENNKNPL
jgi:hypothetical protein